MFRTALVTTLLAVGLLAPAAPAGLIPVQVTVTPETDNYRWTYAITLPSDTLIKTGDYFTVYDFAGMVAGTNGQPDGWAFSTANLGPVPPGVIPTDDPAIGNASWQYTGPETTAGQTGLGNFWLNSLYVASTDSVLTARTHRASDGKTDTNITPTTVPVPTAVATPEPATLALAGLGLPLVALARRARRRA